MKLSKSITFFFTIIIHSVINASWCNICIIFFTFSSNPQYQLIFFLSREEMKVLGEIRELTHPHRITPVAVPSERITPVAVPSERPAPSATASSSGVPPEPLIIKPKTTTVHVTGLYSEWLTLGLPANLCVLPPTKLPGNQSQHTCLLCRDIKMSSNGAYNHIQTEHIGVLLQCCFCSWSSGSACMMQEHLLKYHRKDDGSCMIAGLEPTPQATCH